MVIADFASGEIALAGAGSPAQIEASSGSTATSAGPMSAITFFILVGVYRKLEASCSAGRRGCGRLWLILAAAKDENDDHRRDHAGQPGHTHAEKHPAEILVSVGAEPDGGPIKAIRQNQRQHDRTCPAHRG